MKLVESFSKEYKLNAENKIKSDKENFRQFHNRIVCLGICVFGILVCFWFF